MLSVEWLNPEKDMVASKVTTTKILLLNKVKLFQMLIFIYVFLDNFSLLTAEIESLIFPPGLDIMQRGPQPYYTVHVTLLDISIATS